MSSPTTLITRHWGKVTSTARKMRARHPELEEARWGKASAAEVVSKLADEQSDKDEIKRLVRWREKCVDNAQEVRRYVKSGGEKVKPGKVLHTELNVLRRVEQHIRRQEEA